jgi:KaiC/GvpD/RAD55 family RecA-like ATPase
MNTDRLIAHDQQLTSKVWEEIKEEDMFWNLTVADAIVKVAPFFLIPVKKVARMHKDIFATTLLSAVIDSVSEESIQVRTGSVLDKAYTYIGVQLRERPKLTQWLKDLATNKETYWVQPLSEMPDEEIDWVSENWLQRGVVHQFQGAMDIGKSMLTADIAAQFSAGGNVFGAKVPVGKVLYLSAEDSPTKVIKQRIKSMGGNVENIYALNGKEIPKFPSHMHELNNFVATHRPSLLVVDPILAMFDGDMNSETAVRKVVEGFNLLADFYNITVILVTHTGKARHSNANHNALGSQGMSANARANFHMALDEDTKERIITCVKSNNGGQKLSWSFLIEEHEGFKAPRVVHKGLTDTKAHELGGYEPLKDELKRDILDYISDFEYGVEATALRTFFQADPRVSSSMKTFEYARAELKKSGKIHDKKVVTDGKSKTYWYVGT